MYQQLKCKSKNVRFEHLCRIAEQFSFASRSGKGSHRIYSKAGVRELLNFQDVEGMAKPYGKTAL